MENFFTKHVIITAFLMLLAWFLAIAFLEIVLNLQINFWLGAVSLALTIIAAHLWIGKYTEYDGDPCYGC